MHVRKYKRLFNICHLGITEREVLEDRVEKGLKKQERKILRAKDDRSTQFFPQNLWHSRAFAFLLET